MKVSLQPSYMHYAPAEGDAVAYSIPEVGIRKVYLSVVDQHTTIPIQALPSVQFRPSTMQVIADFV